MFDNVIFCNSCFIDAGTLSRDVYTYESVVMHVRDFTDWVVVFLLCFLSIKKNINLT